MKLAALQVTGAQAGLPDGARRLAAPGGLPVGAGTSTVGPSTTGRRAGCWAPRSASTSFAAAPTRPGSRNRASPSSARPRERERTEQQVRLDVRVAQARLEASRRARRRWAVTPLAQAAREPAHRARSLRGRARGRDLPAARRPGAAAGRGARDRRTRRRAASIPPDSSVRSAGFRGDRVLHAVHGCFRSVSARPSSPPRCGGGSHSARRGARRASRSTSDRGPAQVPRGRRRLRGRRRRPGPDHGDAVQPDHGAGARSARAPGRPRAAGPDAGRARRPRPGRRRAAGRRPARDAADEGIAAAQRRARGREGQPRPGQGVATRESQSLRERNSATAHELDEADGRPARRRGASGVGRGARCARPRPGLASAARRRRRRRASRPAFATVTAPFDGVVTEKLVEPGNMVAPGHAPAASRADRRVPTRRARRRVAASAFVKLGDSVPGAARQARWHGSGRPR